MSQNEIYVLLVSSLRYCLTKPGHHIEEICQLVKKYASMLTKTQLEVLLVEVRSQAHTHAHFEELTRYLNHQMACYNPLV